MENTTLRREPNSMSAKTANKSIYVALGALTAVSTLVFHYFYHFRTIFPQAPFEDAAMLMRYANNLAAGHGIVWNAGEHPSESDGATDLGFVLSLALVRLAGLDVNVGAFMMTIAATGVLGAILMLAALREGISNTKALLAGLAVIILFSGPASSYLAAGFSPVIFAVFLTSLAALPLVWKSGETSFLQILLFGAGMSLAGWWRPEGFVLGPLVGITALILREVLGKNYTPKPSLRRLLKLDRAPALVVGFLAPLILYLVFRLVIFGQISTTSIVNKGTLNPIVSNFIYSLAIFLILTLPLWGMLFQLIRNNKFPAANALLLFLLCASGVWLFVAPANNWWFRMQWPLLPPIVLFLVVLIIHLQDREQLKSLRTSAPKFAGSSVPVTLTWLAIFSIATAGASNLILGKYFEASFHTKFVSSVEGLNSAPIRLATTEAGLIPLTLDEAQVMDTWGLNSRRVAETNGLELPQLLFDFEPNLVIVHGYPPEGIFPGECSNKGGEWDGMVNYLYEYIKMPSSDLILVRSDLTGHCDAWSIFASPDLDEDWIRGIEAYQTLGQEVFFHIVAD